MGTAMRRRRRRCDVPTPRGSQHVCVIGPEGPIIVRPEGLTGLKARQPATVRATALPVLNLHPNKRARQIEHRIRPVPDSHQQHQIYLSTSGRLHRRRHRRGSICCQSWPENLLDRTLVSSKMWSTIAPTKSSCRIHESFQSGFPAKPHTRTLCLPRLGTD